MQSIFNPSPLSDQAAIEGGALFVALALALGLAAVLSLASVLGWLWWAQRERSRAAAAGVAPAPWPVRGPRPAPEARAQAQDLSPETADALRLHDLPHPAVIVDEHVQLLSVNAAGQALLALVGAEPLRRALQALLANGPPQLLTELTLSGGGVPPVLEVSARRLELGSPHGVPMPRWLVMLRDLTDVVHRRQVAESHRQRLLQTLDATGMAIWEWDVAQERLYASPRAWQLTFGDTPLPPEPRPTGLSFDEVLGHIHPDDRQRVAQQLVDGMAHLDTFEYRARTVGCKRVGLGAETVETPVWMHSWAQVLRDAEGRPVSVRGLMRDVTAEHRMVKELERSREELQRLSASLLKAREEERRHIARELHDELGQRLSLLKIHLTGMVDNVSGAGVLQVLQDPLLEALDDADEVIRSLRRISGDLRPPMLDDLGLASALEWLAGEYRQRFGLTIDSHCAEVEALPEGLDARHAITVFRMVQEGLNNAHRHAQARRIEVAVRVDGDHLEATVRDDGIGLPAHGDRPADSWGLVGLRERASLLGGCFKARKHPDGGTLLTMRLPRGSAPPPPPGASPAMPAAPAAEALAVAPTPTS